MRLAKAGPSPSTPLRVRMTNFFVGGRLGNCGVLAVGVLRFAQDDSAFRNERSRGGAPGGGDRESKTPPLRLRSGQALCLQRTQTQGRGTLHRSKSGHDGSTESRAFPFGSAQGRDDGHRSQGRRTGVSALHIFHGCNGLALSKAGVRAGLPLIAKSAKSGERNGKSSNWLRWRLPRGPLLEMREKWGTRGGARAAGILRLRRVTRFAHDPAALRMTGLRGWTGVRNADRVRRVERAGRVQSAGRALLGLDSRGRLSLHNLGRARAPAPHFGGGPLLEMREKWGTTGPTLAQKTRKDGAPTVLVGS